MAVTNTSIDFKRRSYSENPDTGEATYRMAWIVECDDYADGPGVARAGVTIASSVTVSGNTMNLAGVSSDPIQDQPDKFIVSASYSSKALVYFDNPLSRPIRRRWGFRQSTEGKYRDAVGDLVKNSAGETYDPAVEVEIYDPVLTITKNVSKSSFTAAQAVEAVNKVNSDPFYGASAGQARIIDISADETLENGVEYWALSYTVAFRKDGWRTNVLDEGFYALVDVDGSQVPFPITDGKGETKTTPTRLDGNGQELASGANPVFHEKTFYESMNFAPLGLT